MRAYNSQAMITKAKASSKQIPQRKVKFRPPSSHSGVVFARFIFIFLPPLQHKNKRNICSATKVSKKKTKHDLIDLKKSIGKNALRYAALSSFRFDRFHQFDDR